MASEFCVEDAQLIEHSKRKLGSEAHFATSNVDQTVNRSDGRFYLGT